LSAHTVREREREREREKRERERERQTYTHTRDHPLLRSRRRRSPSTSKPVAMCETVYTLRAVVCKEAWFIRNRKKSGRGV
jgi:hypothetical protein